MHTPINPRHLRLSIEFVHNTYCACVDGEKRSYWRRVVNAVIMRSLRTPLWAWTNPAGARRDLSLMWCRIIDTVGQEFHAVTDQALREASKELDAVGYGDPPFSYASFTQRFPLIPL